MSFCKETDKPASPNLLKTLGQLSQQMGIGDTISSQQRPHWWWPFLSLGIHAHLLHKCTGCTGGLSFLIDVMALRLVLCKMCHAGVHLPSLQEATSLAHQLHDTARAYWLCCSWRQNKRSGIFFLPDLFEWPSKTICAGGVQMTYCREVCIGLFFRQENCLKARLVYWDG